MANIAGFIGTDEQAFALVDAERAVITALEALENVVPSLRTVSDFALPHINEDGEKCQAGARLFTSDLAKTFEMIERDLIRIRNTLQNV